jgi:peptidoglycan/LPS O-acetylase OafA/YrhL
MYKKDHIPELDGIRAIAVLLIMWIHLPVSFMGATSQELRKILLPGSLGMDLFFVLSGFLITRILLVDRETPHALRDFLTRRFIRIFPTYYLLLAVLVPAMMWEEIVACATYTTNYAFLFMHRSSYMGHAWSLAVEEQFYLIWSPIVILLTTRASRRVILFVAFPITIATCLAAFVFGDWVAHPEQMEKLLMHGATTRIGALGVGSLLAYHEVWVRRGGKRLVILVVATAGFALLLSQESLSRLGLMQMMFDVAPDGVKPRNFLVALRLFSVPAVALAWVMLAVGTTGSASPWGLVLRAPLMRGIGRISYGLYLYHYPIFRKVRMMADDPNAPEDWTLVVGIVLTFAVAIASYYLIERPLMRWGKRFRAPVEPQAPAA